MVFIREEDANHVLFDCSFARALWLKVGIQEVNVVSYAWNIVEFIQHLFNICTMDKLVWIVMVCWSLWNRKNKWVWDKVNVSEFGAKFQR